MEGPSGATRNLGVAADTVWGRAPWSRVDGALMFLLGLQSLVYTWPHRSRFVNVWDSTLFSFAVFDYDFMRGHPHPPGYPVFVALCRVASIFIDDPHVAVQAVSATLGAAAVACLYGLVRELGSRGAGVVAATLFALAPNHVYNGALALSYTAEALASVLVAWLAWRARAVGSVRRLALLGAVFAATVGVRPSVAIYLAPLLLWAAWPLLRRRQARPLAIAAASGVITGLAWFVPMTLTGGGLDAWLATTRLQSGAVVFGSSVFRIGWEAVADHGGRFWFYLQSDRALAWVGLPTLALLAVAARAMRRPPEVAITRFLLVWLLPSVLFFVFVFSGWGHGPRGYALVVLPGLYGAYALAAGWLTRAAFAHQPRASASPFAAVAMVLVLVTPSLVLVPDGQALIEKEIRGHDDWAQAWMGIRGDFPPNETAILSSYSWAFAQWHFHDYLVWGYLADTPLPGPSTRRIVIETHDRHDDRPLFGIWTGRVEPTEHVAPAWVRRVVILDFQIAGENGEDRRLRNDIVIEEARVGNDWRILYFEPPSNGTVEEWFS